MSVNQSGCRHHSTGINPDFGGGVCPPHLVRLSNSNDLPIYNGDRAILNDPTPRVDRDHIFGVVNQNTRHAINALLLASISLVHVSTSESVSCKAFRGPPNPARSALLAPVLNEGAAANREGTFFER